MKISNIFVLCLAVFFSGTACFQGQEKNVLQLGSSDFSQWHSLFANGLSEDASWGGYKLSYENTDTLFARSTRYAKTYAFPKGKQGRFLGKSSFACLFQNNVLQITDLETGTSVEASGISDYQPVKGGSLLFAEFLQGSTKTLFVLSLEGKVLWSLKDVTDYALNDNLDGIAYCVQEGPAYKVKLASFGNEIKSITIAESTIPINVFSWQPAGRSIAFAPVTTDQKGKRTNTAAFFYDLSRKKLYPLDRDSAEMPEGMELAPIFLHDFRVADDGERLFLSLRGIAKRQLSQEPGLQIWNSSDKESYPVNQIRAGEGEFLFSVWHPAKKTLDLIGTKMSEEVILAGNQSVALVYDFHQYLPTMSHHPDRDIYIRNLATGKKSLFLERFSGFDEMLSVSPGGKFIAYFKDGDWWQYSIGSGKRVRASRKEEGSVELEGFDRPSAPLPAGAPLWSTADADLLYYDHYDIWKYTASNGRRTRLTKGKETGMVFRFYNADGHPTVHFQKEAMLDLSKPVVLQGRTADHRRTGFFLLQEKKLDTLVYKEAKITGFAFSKDRKSYRYMEQRSDLPPRLVVGNAAKSEEQVLISSNVQQDRYDFGKTKLLHYTNKTGKPMSGILYYPHHYDPAKKYPMVVYVYERQSHRLHDYMNPSLANETGFNPSLLSSEGYFVFRPDIYYETGSVGQSAVDCVVAGTEKAISSASIDRKKIGLMGASFGGYETNFIISQTDLFSVAIAGSSMNDFISGYFSLNNNDKLFDSWRYTTHQPRMDSSPFENWDGYLKNSPLRFAPDIKTPLLLWVGSDDIQVSPMQTMELFSAMRILGKECSLLLYEGEDHALREKANQRNLTLKVMEWFGHYLKGMEKPTWALPFKL